MNNFENNLKFMMITYFNNVCLRYKDCAESCPLKCGFDSLKYRCFFDCEEERVEMDFSDNVFYERGKTPPFPLIKLRSSTCNNRVDDCDNCSWFYNDKCKLFQVLKNRYTKKGCFA